MNKMLKNIKTQPFSPPLDFARGTGKMIMLFLSITYSLLFSVFSYAQSSVLATGEWYKIATTRTGVHKIDATFLRDAGIDIAKLNPQNIRIFGNGGGVLPQANNALRA